MNIVNMFAKIEKCFSGKKIQLNQVSKQKEVFTQIGNKIMGTRIMENKLLLTKNFKLK